MNSQLHLATTASLTFCLLLVAGVGWADPLTPCKPGQVRNLATAQHCCWPGQSWSRDQLRCVGRANCPVGFERANDGASCTAFDCQGGRVLVSGRCCWPNQVWSTAKNQCTGPPRCPRGHVAVKAECVPTKAPKTGARLEYRSVKTDDYVTLEPGVYLRGSPRKEPGRFRNEAAHTVAMTRRVLLKKTEVTQREWLQLVPINPSLFAECGLECPVERVNWYEALEWLNRLSIAEGLTPCYGFKSCTGTLGGGCRAPVGSARTCVGDFVCQGVTFRGLQCSGYRLPSEAEWEYAARAGTTTSTYGGNLTLNEVKDAFVLDPLAWYRRNSNVRYVSGQACSTKLAALTKGPRCGTHPVGRKAPTDWGHVDLLGNLMEWVWDGYGTYPPRSAVDPINQLGLYRIVRGGSWATDGRYLRSALRSRLDPRGRNAELGFRAARTLIGPVGKKAAPKSKVQRKIRPAQAPAKPSSAAEVKPFGPPMRKAPGGAPIYIKPGAPAAEPPGTDDKPTKKEKKKRQDKKTDRPDTRRPKKPFKLRVSPSPQ